MGPPKYVYVGSVVDRNVVMRRTPVQTQPNGVCLNVVQKIKTSLV